MEGVNEIEEMTIEEATEQLSYINKIITKEKYVKDLQKVYESMAEGKKVIDLYEVFKEIGTDEKGLPKIAIARADRKVITLTSRGNFAYREFKELTSFGYTRNRWVQKMDYSLPRDTFPNLIKFELGTRYETKVPIIPVKYYPQDSLINYYILWEVEDWERIETPPEDPLLLKKLTKNLFAIIAEWNLTPLEKAITKGR